MTAQDVVLQGKNEYLYFFITRDLECIGTGDGNNKSFTTKKSPLADVGLNGTVTTADIEVYVGASRSVATAVTVSSVTEATGAITLSAAPGAGAKVYATYGWVFGEASYVQDYSVTITLESKDITPLSEDSEETIETSWKYEGNIKLWNANDLEEDLMQGINQANDTVGGTYSPTLKIPTITHQLIVKRVRGTDKKYRALGVVKITSLDESGKGGDLSEKTIKFKSKDLYMDYTPTAGSGI